MESLQLAMMLRGTERLLVVAGGILAIYLGYRLFLAMPDRDQGTGKFELPGGISIYMSRVGPGVFFSLFGTAVIALALYLGVDYSEQAGAARNADVRTASVADRKYSGIGDGGGSISATSLETERVNTLIAVRNLNRALPALAKEVPPAARVDISQAVSLAKRRLMQGVWDSEKWGNRTTFERWLDDGEPAPVPPGLVEAVQAFRAGDQN